ncbi:MAG: cell division protein FtsX, partial [Candidatus Binatia bacterium]
MRRTRATRQPPAFYLRRAVDSILATPVISSVTITSIAVSVLLAGAVLLVGSNVYRLVANWGTQGVDVSIYVEAGVDDARVVELKRQLGGEPGVVSLSYISQDEAWQFLASNLGDSAELLDGLDASVLPASFELTLERSLSGDALEERLDAWRAIPGIDDVQYNRQWTNRFRGAMDIVRWVAWALGALALIASTIIVGATF